MNVPLRPMRLRFSQQLSGTFSFFFLRSVCTPASSSSNRWSSGIPETAISGLNFFYWSTSPCELQDFLPCEFRKNGITIPNGPGRELLIILLNAKQVYFRWLFTSICMHSALSWNFIQPCFTCGIQQQKMYILMFSSWREKLYKEWNARSVKLKKKSNYFSIRRVEDAKNCYIIYFKGRRFYLYWLWCVSHAGGDHVKLLKNSWDVPKYRFSTGELNSFSYRARIACIKDVLIP